MGLGLGAAALLAVIAAALLVPGKHSPAECRSLLGEEASF